MKTGRWLAFAVEVSFCCFWLIMVPLDLLLRCWRNNLTRPAHRQENHRPPRLRHGPFSLLKAVGFIIMQKTFLQGFFAAHAACSVHPFTDWFCVTEPS